VRPGRILDPVIEEETAADRERRLASKLRETVAHARANSAYFRRTLPAKVERLEDIPITRKDDLPALQAADPPFGGLIAVEASRLARVFSSPGPILDPQGDIDDFWRFRMALAAAGFRQGDVVLNSSSYHLTPLGFMLDSAARTLGCVVVPAGTGQTDLQVGIAATLRASGYLGTPSFLYTLLKRGRELGTPLQTEVAFVTGEMLPESLRAEMENDFKVRVLQGYGTADLGLLAYECPEKGGMHLHPECILEVLDLETGAPLPRSSSANRVISRRGGRRSAWRSPARRRCGPHRAPSPRRAARPRPAPRPPPRRERAPARTRGGPGGDRG